MGEQKKSARNHQDGASTSAISLRLPSLTW